MAWEQRNVVEQRIEFVSRYQLGEESLASLCREYKISRVTGYKWIDRYQSAGTIEGLKDQSRRPSNSPNRTSTALEEKVVSLYHEYGWGPKKIRVLLLREKIDLPLITVRRIYKRHGLSQEIEGVGAAPNRFEREQPNELVQMDYKGQFKLGDQSWCYPLTLLDDHSRYCLGLHALSNQSGEDAEKKIFKTFETYGVPDGMLMDHGTPWWNHANKWGLTKLSVKLIKHGIKISFSRIRHPQTQGKVERFHRTLKQELARKKDSLSSLSEASKVFDEFRNVYNSIRPHEALNQKPPRSKYQPSRKQLTDPLKWEYPYGSEVVKVDQLGRISYSDKRFFVCEALSDEQVRVLSLEDSALVIYRDMAIREIDLDTGASVPAVFHVGENFAPLG